MVYDALPNYIHMIITTSDCKWDNDTKLDAEVGANFYCLLDHMNLPHRTKAS